MKEQVTEEGNRMIAELNRLYNHLQREMRIKFSIDGLKLLGLKAGDIVKCEFRISYLSGKESYGNYVIDDGVIKIDEFGIAYVESYRPLPNSYSKNNNLSGRQRKDWWEIKNVFIKAELFSIKFPFTSPSSPS